MKYFAILANAALLACIALVTLATMKQAQALECGTYDGHKCSNSDFQFAGGFNPSGTQGGFGGGSCTATRTPVIFVHGNSESALHWDITPDGGPGGYTVPAKSVYDEFKSRGYNDCELFGVSYLTTAQRQTNYLNYHEASKQSVIRDFIDAVKAYTGKSQVDIIGHSLGVSMSLSALYRYNRWSSVRRFINVAGGIRGLKTCLYVGYANAAVPTCGGMNIYNYNIFGFYPSTDAWFAAQGRNDWTSGVKRARSMRWMPDYHTSINFYTIHAGQQDQIMCTTLLGWGTCADTPLFKTLSNVKSQLNVGAGSYAPQLDFDFTDYNIYNLDGGDTDGVGHIRARMNTGKIMYQMLNSSCTGLACAGDYNHGPVQ